MTVAGILLTIPLVSSASSTGERLETRNAATIVLALMELVHLHIKQIAHGKTAGNVEIINVWRCCNPSLCGLLLVYLYYCPYEPINTLQVYIFVARLDRLRNCARHPGEVCQYGIYEQTMKSCQNQGQILRKSYFGFSCRELHI